MQKSFYDDPPQGYLTLNQIQEKYNISVFMVKKMLEPHKESLIIQESNRGGAGRYLVPESIAETFSDHQMPENLDGYLDSKETARLFGITSSYLLLLVTKWNLESEILRYGSGGKRCSKNYYSPELIEKIRILYEQKEVKQQKYERTNLYIDDCYMTPEAIEFFSTEGVEILETEEGLVYPSQDRDLLSKAITNYMKSIGYLPLSLAKDIFGVSRQRVHQIVEARGELDDESKIISVRSIGKPKWFINKEYIDQIIEDRDKRGFVSTVDLSQIIPNSELLAKVLEAVKPHFVEKGQTYYRISTLREVAHKLDTKIVLASIDTPVQPADWVSLSSVADNLKKSNQEIVDAMATLSLHEKIRLKRTNGKARLVHTSAVPELKDYFKRV